MTNLIQLSRKKVGNRSEKVWEALNEFLAFSEPQHLSPAQKAAALAYEYASSIESGGHDHYFSLVPQPDHHEVISALRLINAAEQASILSAALEAIRLAGRQAPQIYAKVWAAGVDRADLEEFDLAFGHCKKTVPQCLVDHVLSHDAAFIEWHE